MRFRSVEITIPFIIMVALNAAAVVSGTIRLDFFHTGNIGQELFSVDRIVVEPLPWPGNPNKPIDSTNRGTYFFEIRDQSSRRILYSRVFSSIYGEWVTTDEAKNATRTFHESLRFPAPDAPVQVVVNTRNAQNTFVDVWSTTVDPQDKAIDASKPPFSGRVIEIQKNGDPLLKIDLLFLGEGYSGAEQDKCEKDIRRLNDGVFTYSPFKERRVISTYGLSALHLLIRVYRSRLAVCIETHCLVHNSTSSPKNTMRCRLITSPFVTWRRSLHTMSWEL